MSIIDSFLLYEKTIDEMSEEELDVVVGEFRTMRVPQEGDGRKKVVRKMTADRKRVVKEEIDADEVEL